MSQITQVVEICLYVQTAVVYFQHLYILLCYFVGELGNFVRNFCKKNIVSDKVHRMALRIDLHLN